MKPNILAISIYVGYAEQRALLRNSSVVINDLVMWPWQIHFGHPNDLLYPDIRLWF